MSRKTRASLLSLTIIVVIVFSAFGTTPVYADGDPPPNPPPAEATSPPEDANPEEASPPTVATEEPTTPDEVSPEATGVPTEAIAEETSAPEEATGSPEATAEVTDAEVTAEATSTPEEASAEEATDPQSTEEVVPVVEESTPAPDTSILNEVPENTTVTVLDANGDVQPLATQEAAEAIVTSDPMWCPDGISPGGVGCTPSFTSFTALLTELATGAYSGPGTIYVQQGAYQGGESTIELNPTSLPNIGNANLTVVGGWNPTTNVVDPANPSTFNGTPIIIGASGNPWGGSLTIRNISISDTAGNGLTLFAQNNILLSNVNVTNAQSGAGAELEAGGSVTVMDSNFTRNRAAGAIIRSGSSVDVLRSTFSNPADARRQYIGLNIARATGVSLFDVVANENRIAGADINASGTVSITRSVFSGTKETQGTQFLGYGLQVVTPGTVALNNVTANDNFLWGASLDADGNIAIADSVFNANTTASPGFIDDTGIFINGGSNVSLTNVTADFNRLYGAKIDALGSVVITNGSFSNNRGEINTGGVTTFNGHGLQITSPVGIFLTNVTATNNMLFGAELSSAGTVSVSSSTFSNTSTGSSANALGKGLDIITTGTGNVSLFQVVLNNNQTVGANIQAVGNVSLNNVTATNNGSDGVVVQAACVQVTGGTYTGNGGLGLNRGNTPDCDVLLGTGTTATNAVPSNNVFASLQTAPQQSDNTNGILIPLTGAIIDAGTDTNARSVTLNSLMTNIRTTTGGMRLSIFTGKYVYIYSSSGMHIIAFAPSSGGIAMDESYKAY